METEHLIGVIGGMGPESTVDFMRKLIEMTDAHNDQEHIPLLVSSMPNFPDRSHHLLRGGESPLPALLERLHLLERAGATCIVMVCNTAHYWFDQLQAATTVQMLSMIDAVADAAKEAGFAKVGLLSTDATMATRMYQKSLKRADIECVTPNEALQKKMIDGIYAWKSGIPAKARDDLDAPYRYVAEQGVDAIILGCTELPLILEDAIRENPSFFLDSNRILAQAVIRWYETRQ
jgi:aspartate racemase